MSSEHLFFCTRGDTVQYSLMNMRLLHILFNSAKTWHVIFCWSLSFFPNLPGLNLKLFCSDVQNNFRFSSGKFGEKHWNQQTIKCQILAEQNEIWSCLIFIKLYHGGLWSRELGQAPKLLVFLTPRQASLSHLWLYWLQDRDNMPIAFNRQKYVSKNSSTQEFISRTLLIRI